MSETVSSSARAAQSFGSSKRKRFGLFTRRERWGLSWQGWMALVLFVPCGSAAFVFGIYPFLATTDRVDSKILVVEGWVPLYAVKGLKSCVWWSDASKDMSGLIQNYIAHGGGE